MVYMSKKLNDNLKSTSPFSPEEWEMIFGNSIERYEKSHPLTNLTRWAVKIMIAIFIIFFIIFMTGIIRICIKI